MRLGEYLKLPGAKTLRALADKSGVSFLTVRSVARGMRLKNYDVASALSAECTVDGEVKVSVDDLCKE